MSNKDPSSAPNLNSPPGMTPPHQPPPASALSAAQQTGQTRSTPLETANPQAKPDPQKLIYYSCLAVTLTAPLIAVLPPRRLNPQTFGLAIAWCASAGVVLEMRTGHGLLWHVGALIPSATNAERRAREHESSEAVRGALREGVRQDGTHEGGLVDSVRTQQQQQQQQQQREKQRERGVVRRLWMGREGDDWIEKRAREEREALEDGRGYSGLIADYVGEAFGIKRWLSGDGDDDDDGGDGEGERKRE